MFGVRRYLWAKVFRTDDRLGGLVEEGADVGGVGPALDGAPSIGFDCWLRQYWSAVREL